MKKFTNQFNGSHADRINNGGGRFRRIALFPLMLFMLLLVPTSMMAQTDYDNTVTFTALAGNPQGFPNETYAELFDGKKTKDKFSKWCCKFSRSANVIFAASKAGVPVGYTITTGNDNFTSKGRNPMSWKLYGNNVGKDGEWTLIQEVNNDTKLQDVNYTSYDFTCGGGKSYKYFKWEISAIHSGDVLQVGEFELKLQTCTHTNADGSSALGNAIKTVETTCTEHGYTTYKCSICHSTVKKYKTDELKKHTLTYHEAKDGVKEHWQCDVCHKYFSDADATQEVSYASLLYPAYAVFEGSTGTLTFKCSPSKPERAYDLNREWSAINENIKKVVFDASFANARPASCYKWFCGCVNLAQIEGIEYLNTEEVTNMAWMFKGCSNLKSLDVSKFNTAQVTDMSYMFTHCWGLESLDVSRLNTENVTNMENMFLYCSNSKLTSLDVSNFNTEKVTNMSCMFRGNSNLTSLDLSNFNTQDVKDMSYMLMDCRGLTSLNLSGFNTPNVENMSGMFNGCYDLTTIYVSDKFVTTKVSDGTDMFYGCTSLKGAIKYEDSSYGYPEYSEGNNDHTYANYKTGYFTKLVGKNGNDKIGAVGEVLTAESLALADDKDFEAYEPFTAKTATYTRTLKEGTSWATLCLPFEVSLADQNFRAFELLSADETTNTVELKEIETSIAAGTPVIIKMKEGQTAHSFSVANKEIANNVKTAATVDGSYQLQGLYTKKVFDKDADNNCYIVKGDKLMNPTKLLENTSTTQVGSKPFRAYMVDNTSSSAGAKMFGIAIGDNTTAIDSLNTIADDKAVYYDLQGNRLSAPQKGINIVKRGSKTMKVIIK